MIGTYWSCSVCGHIADHGGEPDCRACGVCMRKAREAREAKVYVEASTVGLAPGHWPSRLSFDDELFDFVELVRDRDGDVLEATYRGPRRSLVIWND